MILAKYLFPTLLPFVIVVADLEKSVGLSGPACYSSFREELSVDPLVLPIFSFNDNYKSITSKK